MPGIASKAGQADPSHIYDEDTHRRMALFTAEEVEVIEEMDGQPFIAR